MHDRREHVSESLLNVLRRVAGPSTNGTVPLHAPEFRGNERDYLVDCIDTTFVSSVGKYVDRFEERLAEYLGAKHAVAVVNGTAALQVALHVAGMRPGDEVIVPALSFVATANAVAHGGGVPHFVDSDEGTMGMAVGPLASHLRGVAERSSRGVVNKTTGRRIAAIVPMHTFGHPVDMKPLIELAEGFGIPVVEDAAESLGSTYHGQHMGTFGQLAAMSFNGNKIVTTGGGGAIITNDPELAREAKHLTTTAKLPHRWAFNHDQVAWNYRMPNINAAVGCGQLERLPDMLERKRRLAHSYQAELQGQTDVRFMTEPPNTTSNYWLNTVLLPAGDAGLRDHVLEQVNSAGYQVRPAWTLLSRLPMYAGSPRSALDTAEDLEGRILNLPSSPNLADPD